MRHLKARLFAILLILVSLGYELVNLAPELDNLRLHLSGFLIVRVGLRHPTLRLEGSDLALPLRNLTI